MYKIAIFLITLFLILSGCAAGGADSDDSGYTITVKLTNLPSGTTGNIFSIDVYEQTSAYTSVETGMIDSTVDSDPCSRTVKAYVIPYGIQGYDKEYSGTVTLSFEIYMDVDGNGLYNNSGDISDAISHEDVQFSTAATYEIDCSTLNRV